jgi:hypothetical protein
MYIHAVYLYEITFEESADTFAKLLSSDKKLGEDRYVCLAVVICTITFTGEVIIPMEARPRYLWEIQTYLKVHVCTNLVDEHEAVGPPGVPGHPPGGIVLHLVVLHLNQHHTKSSVVEPELQ